MSHLETDADQFLDHHQDNTITLQRAVSTIAVLVLVYYLQQYITYETTIQRILYEFATWLIPAKLIRLLQRMLGGYTGRSSFVHHGSHHVFNRAGSEDSTGSGTNSIVQKARTLSGINRIMPTSTEMSFAGLGNLDNSCYQNSVLQGLASLDNFQQFINGSAEQSYDLKISADTQYALYHFIAELRQERVGRSTTWTPNDLKSMDSWQQQDAQEYFSKIMDAVEKESVRARRVADRKHLRGLESLRLEQNGVADLEELVASRSDGSALKKAQDVNNPVDGLLAQRLVCQTCKTSEGVTFMPFNCLTLNLESINATHLEALLTTYTNFELLEGIECDECTLRAYLELEAETMKPSKKNKKKKKLMSNGHAILRANNDQPAQKTEKVRTTKAKELRLGRLPQDLVFHINRSIFDMYGNQRKNSSIVEFPSRLEIADDWVLSLTPDFQDTHAVYELRCVVTHYGRHDNGHYIAYGKRGKNWYEFNDAKVRRVKEEEVLRCGNVFILFYEVLPAVATLETELGDVVKIQSAEAVKAKPKIEQGVAVEEADLGKENELPVEPSSPGTPKLAEPA
ncbi:hypothetical protein LTR66_015611 [Elasticomyces elasticus]|nr:hypothetical protein LTR66_015611 [Elasticomyces elasticus]